MVKSVYSSTTMSSSATSSSSSRGSSRMSSSSRSRHSKALRVRNHTEDEDDGYEYSDSYDDDAEDDASHILDKNHGENSSVIRRKGSSTHGSTTMIPEESEEESLTYTDASGSTYHGSTIQDSVTYYHGSTLLGESITHNGGSTREGSKTRYSSVGDATMSVSTDESSLVTKSYDSVDYTSVHGESTLVSPSTVAGNSRARSSSSILAAKALLATVQEQAPAVVTPRNGTKNDSSAIKETSSLEKSKLSPSALDGEEALLDLVELEKLQGEAERMKALGNKHMADQEYTKAFNAYSAALELAPVGSSSHVYLANRAAALLSLKQYEAAAKDAQRAIGLAPSFGKAHARLGQALYFVKDYEGAVKAYDDALQYEPDNEVTITYRNKAQVKLEKALSKQKLKDERRRQHGNENGTVGSTTNSSRVSFGPSIATTLPPSEDQSTLTSEWENASNLGPSVVSESGHQYSSVPSVQEDSVGSKASSRPPLSTQSMGTSVSSRPQSSDAPEDPDFDEAIRLQQRANQYLATKQYKAAVEEYTAALFLVPDDVNLSPDLHLGRAHALNGARRHEGARNDAMLALKMRPSPAAYSTLAKSLFYLKDYAGSIQAFYDCINLLPAGETLGMFDQAYLQKAEAAFEEEEASLKEAGMVSSRASASSSKSPVPKLPPPRFVPREEQSNLSLRPMPKTWPTQSPQLPTALSTGPEHPVVFLSESLGVKLNRGPDGIVRVLSVIPNTPSSPVAREGVIEKGYVVREAAGVDLRRPITNVMWGDTVALIKMAPRPITLIVATELSAVPPAVIAEQERASRKGISEDASLSGGSAGASSREGKLAEDPQMMSTMPLDDSKTTGTASVTRSTGASVTRSTGSRKGRASPESGSLPSRASGLEPTATTAAATLADALENEEEVDDAVSPQQHQDETPVAVQEAPPPDSSSTSNAPTDASPEEAATTIAKLPTAESAEPDEAPPAEEENKKEKENEGEDDDIVEEEDVVDKSEGADVKSEAKVVEDKEKQDTAVVEDPRNDANEVSEADTVEAAKSEAKAQMAAPLSLRDEEENVVGGEIIFARESPPSYCGWDNLRWLSYSGARKVRMCQPVCKRIQVEKKGLIFSKTKKEYRARHLAIYDEPSLILLLRRPDNAEEVRSILGLPDIAEMEEGEKAVLSYWIVESVADPATCKMQLSTLTTVTSVAPEGADDREKSCFRIETPVESLKLSAVRRRKESSQQEESFSDSGAFLETMAVETQLVQAILRPHTSGGGLGAMYADSTWKHQIIMGTLHAVVLCGNETALQTALQQAMTKTKGTDEEQLEAGKLPSRIVDAVDDSGYTPLYYACARNMPFAVSALVSAGADVGFVNVSNGMTLLHICAQNLDSVSLSTILSVPQNARPNASAIDARGRTPMHVAAVDGNLASEDADKDAATEALGRCLAALEAWGGQFLAPNPLGILRHPVSSVASSWRSDDLAVVLRHVHYRYPLAVLDGGESAPANSVSELFHYPLHSVIFSMPELVASGDEEKIWGAMTSIQLTIEALVEHGFEPNERLDRPKLVGSGPVDLFLEYEGFSPLQVLASISLSVQKDSSIPEVLQGPFRAVVTAAADSLIQNGARTNLEPPNLKKLKRKTSNTSTSSDEGAPEIRKKDLAALKIESNKDTLEAIGGADRVNQAKKDWALLPPVETVGALHLAKAGASEGGSDDKSCSLCWKGFGLMTRKFRCEVSGLTVCDECSSKRIRSGGTDYRVTDGQYLLARADAAKKAKQEEEVARAAVAAQEAAIAQEPTKQESRKSLFGLTNSFRVRTSSEDHATTTTAKSLADVRRVRLEAEEHANRDSLFGGMLEQAKQASKAMLGTDDKASSARGQVDGLTSTLSDTRDALNERGHKINALSEKSEQVVDASAEFARMAKELRKKTESRGFW